MNFNTDIFSYDKIMKTFVQEISTLDIKGRMPKRITLTNQNSGGSKTFFYSSRYKVGEELGGWIYTSKDGLMIEIFND